MARRHTQAPDPSGRAAVVARSPVDISLVIPQLPRPRREVTERYLNQLVSAVEHGLDVLNAVRQRTFTEISLTNTQEHGGNLRVGTVFSDGGTLRIVRTGDVFAGTTVGTGAVGTVTVSTP